MNKSRIDLFIENLNSCILENHEIIKDIFNFEYGYPELDPVRDEICKCIICDLPQAAITLTNHLLESSLKKCLIMKHSIINKEESTQLDNAFKDGLKKYDKLDLEQSINQACSKGLVTKEQKKQLKKFKDDFRNPYSHATSEEIFKDNLVKGQTISLIEGESPEKLLERIFNRNEDKPMLVRDILPFHGIVQVNIAKKESVPYFIKVDEIIREMLKKLKAEPLT